MSNQNSTSSSRNRKELLRKDIREGIEGLKGILVGTLALIFKVSESISNRNKSSSIRSFSNFNSKKNTNSSLSFVEKNNSDETEAVDVSIEINERNLIKNVLQSIKNSFYPVLALISTAALITGVKKIDPLIDWARIQNECIQENVDIDGIPHPNLASKVMTCNGGHSN